MSSISKVRAVWFASKSFLHHGKHSFFLTRTQSRSRHALKTIACLIALTISPMGAWPAQQSASGSPAPQDISSASIEDLMNIQVTSVSKTEQSLSRTASAVFVVSQEDIRRSGATNIPDVLRMVPGVQVAQINANTWAISARGFNDRFSNELMVLVDGRTVYTPTFGGVFWDVLDVPLEDIERIEVIRGPGGSVWGANAVNGVINIITKKAAETMGGLIVAGGGNLDQGFATLQYGGALGAGTNYRVFAKYFNQSSLPGADGRNGGDAEEVLRGGFRTDTVLSRKDTVTMEGDVYDGPDHQPESFLPAVTSPAPQVPDTRIDLSGGSFQTAWNHIYSSRSDMDLSASYDRYSRPDILGETRSSLNIDFQHHFLWRQRQNIVSGVDYRYSASATTGTLFLTLNPADLTTQMYSAFVQDQITVLSDRLYLTIGTKVEHNYYTGFGVMPTVRVAWTPSKRQTVWAAVSRAHRTPKATDASIRLNFGGFTPPGGTPVLFAVFGNPNLQDEGLVAYEAGYRASFSERISVDFAAYYNNYSTKETEEPGAPFFENTPAPAHIVVPTVYENLMHGAAYGFEVFGNWKVSNRWTISPGYAFEQIRMRLEPGSGDTTSVAQAQGSSPANSTQIRSHVFLPRNISWDVSAYVVGRLTDPAIPSYTRLDTGLTWQRAERLSFSVVGQNLAGRHLEFIDLNESTTSSLMKPSVYGKITL